MKTLKQISLLCLFWMIGMSVCAYDFAVENADGVTIYYNITSSTSPKTVEVTNDGNTSTSVYTAKTINIPNTVSYDGNTYGVTGIGIKAFYNASQVKSITLPKFLTSIGVYAFYYCRGLTSITIPNSVTSIGNNAFYGCSGLTSITIPNSVTSIGDYAFYSCSGLTSITIPNSVTSIGNYAFYGCSGLTSITIPNSVTSIGEGAFLDCSGLTSITIPNSVTSIGGSAFYGCSGLTSITIPNSVTSIGRYAFEGCRGLTSITIPNSVTSIGGDAFYGCRGLTSITIPNSVTSIGNYAFYGCSGLTSITIPNSVTSIGEGAFSGCSGLASITVEDGNSYYDSRNGCNAIITKSSNTLIAGCKNTIIPNSVTNIADYAFYGCSDLTSITIPNSVTSIGDYAFYGCSGLTSIAIPNSVKSIWTGAFKNCSGLTSITIPNSVTGIGDYAFYGCSGLTSIAIPNSVKSIGERAFYGCSGLISITIPNSVKSIGTDAFYGCSGLTSVTIGNSVTSIGTEAFYYCSGLTSIILTSKGEPSLGKYAFGDVQKVYYPKLGAYSVSGSQYIPYTNIAIGSDGSVAAETLDDWSEFEIKDAGKEYIVPVELNYYFLGASYTRTFNNHEWQAWYVPADVPFSSLSANFEVAKFSDTQASADEIGIESVTSGTLTANTPYLVRLKDDKATGEYSIVADESAGLKETVENEVNIGSNYKLKTTYRELSGAELKGKYALSEGKFKKAGDSATLKPFRVYLEPVTTGAADVLDLVMDGATDITLTPSSGKGAETIYNLNGQAVGEDYKGVVIKNGKKVFKN